MFNPKWRYPAEKLSAARRNLMAPLPAGEAAAYASAFHECELGLHDVRADDLDDSARAWLRTIQQTMDTKGIEDRSGRGTWHAKAERLTLEEKHAFSAAVDELAFWFDRRMDES